MGTRLMNLSEQKLIEIGYWVAGCRAEKEEISRDTYAKHWLTPDLKGLCKTYMNSVSRYEDIALSLRFRYLFDSTNSFCEKHPNTIFVNVASGLSSYSLLLPKTVRCIEIDHQSVVDKKRDFYNERGFSINNIEWIGSELLNHVDIDNIFEKISELKSDSLCFVFEGILYYLPQDIINYIFSKIGKLPHKYIQVALNTWPKHLEKSSVLKSFVSFSGEKISTNKFTFHNIADLTINGFLKKETKDYLQLFKEYGQKEIQITDNVFWEEFIVFEKS